MTRFALITSDEVANVVEVPTDVVDVETDDETGEVIGETPVLAADYAVRLFGADYDEVIELADDDPTGLGWARPATGQPLAPPPGPPRLDVGGELVGNGVATVPVAYVNEQADAPASVTFTINGAATPIVPLVDGRAELALSAAAPGRVRIEVEGLRGSLTAT